MLFYINLQMLLTTSMVKNVNNQSVNTKQHMKL